MRYNYHYHNYIHLQILNIFALTIFEYTSIFIPNDFTGNSNSTALDSNVVELPWTSIINPYDIFKTLQVWYVLIQKKVKD